MNKILIQNKKYYGTFLFVCILLSILSNNVVSAVSSETIEAPIGTKYHFTTDADEEKWKEGDEGRIFIKLVVETFGEGAGDIEELFVKISVVDSNGNSQYFGTYNLNDMSAPGSQSAFANIELIREEGEDKIKYFNISASADFIQDKYTFTGSYDGAWHHRGHLTPISQITMEGSDNGLLNNPTIKVPIWSILPLLLIPIVFRRKNKFA